MAQEDVQVSMDAFVAYNEYMMGKIDSVARRSRPRT